MVENCTLFEYDLPVVCLVKIKTLYIFELRLVLINLYIELQFVHTENFLGYLGTKLIYNIISFFFTMNF